MTTPSRQEAIVAEPVQVETTERIMLPEPLRRFPRASSIKLPAIEFPAGTEAEEMPPPSRR